MFDWLFGSKSKTNYDDAMKQTQQASKAQADATAYFYDNIDGDKWNTLDDDSKANVLSQYNALNNAATSGAQTANQYNDTYNQELKDNRYNYFGNGLLGSLLNPIGQTASAVKDLATGQYGENGRDAMSDLGAAGQTALSFLPFAGGALARAGGAVGKMGAGLGKAVNSVPGMALTGAGFNAGETLRQGGSQTDIGDLLGSAGTGAAFGAGIPIAGRAIGGALRNRGSSLIGKELAQSGVADDAAQQFMGALPNKALYQTALKSLVPKSTAGKVVVGAGALYGGSRLLGGMGGGQEDPTQQLAAQFQQQYGYTPSDYELQLLMQGGY